MNTIARTWGVIILLTLNVSAYADVEIPVSSDSLMAAMGRVDSIICDSMREACWKARIRDGLDSTRAAAECDSDLECPLLVGDSLICTGMLITGYGFNGIRFNRTVLIRDCRCRPMRAPTSDSERQLTFAIAHCVFLESVEFTNTRFEGSMLFLEDSFSGGRDSAGLPQRVRFENSSFGEIGAFSGCQFDRGLDFHPDTGSMTTFAFENCRINAPYDFRISGGGTEVLFDSVLFLYPIEDTSANGKPLVTSGPAVFWVDSDVRFVSCSFVAPTTIVGRHSGTGAAKLDFGGSKILGRIWIGSNEGNVTFDFSKAHFPSEGRSSLYGSPESPQGPTMPDPRVVIMMPTKVLLQPEHLDHLGIDSRLSYFEKRDIFLRLRDSCITSGEPSRERFELEYWFARQTAFDRQSSFTDPLEWYHPRRWGMLLYNLTLGYGYRPFRLLIWAGGLIGFFATAFYLGRRGVFRTDIANHVRRLDSLGRGSTSNRDRSKPELFYDCLWFSTVMLFAIRLKPRVLTDFDRWEKRWILTEYILGIGLYAYFLLGSKAGSIGMTLIHLFTG